MRGKASKGEQKTEDLEIMRCFMASDDSGWDSCLRVALSDWRGGGGGGVGEREKEGERE